MPLHVRHHHLQLSPYADLICGAVENRFHSETMQGVFRWSICGADVYAGRTLRRKANRKSSRVKGILPLSSLPHLLQFHCQAEEYDNGSWLEQIEISATRENTRTISIDRQIPTGRSDVMMSIGR